jgi:hypothetical protein
MSSLNVKNTFLLNSSFEWISSLHSLIFVSTDSIICDEAIFAWSYSRRKNIVKMTTYHSRLWMSFFMREILRSSCETCLFSHYYLWSRSFRSIQNWNRIFCEILFKIHRKRSSFMNEKCCKQWLMNAKMSRKQDEDETLSNLRLKRLLLFFVFVQAFFAIHSSAFFFQKIFKNFWNFLSCRLYKNLLFFWTSSSSIAFFLIRWRSFSTRRRIQSAVNVVSNFWRWSLLLNAFLMLIDRFAIVMRL